MKSYSRKLVRSCHHTVIISRIVIIIIIMIMTLIMVMVMIIILITTTAY